MKTKDSGLEQATVRRVSFLVASLSLAAATGLQAQVTQQWVAQFEGVLGPGVPVAIGIDMAGHTYVTGSSSGSDGTSTYETVAYDSGGNQLWARDSGGVYDQPSALAVDQNSGTVYVTGMRRNFGFGSTYDYATIAYDSFGNELWVASYDGPAHLDDKPSAIAVDQLGNVYVTGSSDNGDGTDAYATVAYDRTGNQLWASRYNGSSSSDGAVGIALDQYGRTYVTGSVGADYATVAYDSGGNQLWVAHSPGFGGSRPKGIVVNSLGNIVITARALCAGINCYGTVAYDVGGNQLWASYYSGLGYANNEPSALAADGAGNVYVTGWVPAPGTQMNYVTVSYDSKGNQRWVARYNGPGNDNDYSSAIATDTSGNVYVTGRSWGGPDGFDYATVSYDSNGTQRWVARYRGPDQGWYQAYAMAIDALGNVYITGGGGRGAFVTLMYSQS